MPSMSPTGEDPGERFRERYRRHGDALLEAELDVLGSDYRANGYTTRSQADALGRALGLGEGDHLLDIGSGCGWPGLYLASVLGCSVVTIDPVLEGTSVAAARAASDGLGRRHHAVVAEGEALPFRSQSFDAVTHTDVTC